MLSNILISELQRSARIEVVWSIASTPTTIPESECIGHYGLSWDCIKDNMLALRSSFARAAALVVPRRSLAISATVKEASDTSAMSFPAPSHVSLSSEAADLAQQLHAFYSDPESVVSLSEETREALQDEVMKKVSSVPDANVSTAWAEQNLQIPSEIRLGDNPLFESVQKSRLGSK